MTKEYQTLVTIQTIVYNLDDRTPNFPSRFYVTSFEIPNLQVKTCDEWNIQHIQQIYFFHLFGNSLVELEQISSLCWALQIKMKTYTTEKHILVQTVISLNIQANKV